MYTHHEHAPAILTSSQLLCHASLACTGSHHVTAVTANSTKEVTFLQADVFPWWPLLTVPSGLGEGLLSSFHLTQLIPGFRLFRGVREAPGKTETTEHLLRDSGTLVPQTLLSAAPICKPRGHSAHTRGVHAGPPRPAQPPRKPRESQHLSGQPTSPALMSSPRRGGTSQQDCLAVGIATPTRDTALPSGPRRTGAQNRPTSVHLAGVRTQEAFHRRLSPAPQKCGEEPADSQDRPGQCEKSRDSCSRLAKLNPGRGETPTERGSQRLQST